MLDTIVALSCFSTLYPSEKVMSVHWEDNILTKSKPPTPGQPSISVAEYGWVAGPVKVGCLLWNKMFL
jgi:hypothetical protein